VSVLRRAILLLLLAAACARREPVPEPAPVAGASDVQVATDPAAEQASTSRRPHVLVAPDELARLSSRHAQLDRLRRVVSAAHGTPESADELYLTIVNRGLARHLFDDRSQVAPLDRLLSVAQQSLRQAARKPLEDTIDFDIPATAVALGLGYDFVFDDMPAERRGEIATDLDAWGRRFVDAMRGEGPWATDFGNHKAALLHATAVAGAALAPDPAGRRLLDECEREFRERIVPALDVAGRDGGWPEGISYNRKMALSIVGFVEAVQHATGRSLWNVSPWLALNGDYIAYQLLPNGRFLAIGDVTSDVPTALDRLVLGRLGDVFDRREDAGLANDLPALRTYRDDPLLAGLDLVYVDPDPPAPPADTRPLSRTFRGAGLAVLRESRAADAAVVTFRSGDTISAHQHADQNAFTIFRDVPLALDSGVYDDYWSSHSFNYYRRTIAHNTIVVFDPEETFPAPKRLVRQGVTELSNDGGQDLFGAVPHSMEDYREHRNLLDTGDLDAFVSRGAYDYVRGDATRAYSRRKLERFVREMLFLRRERPGGNTLLLVLDDVKLARPGLRPTWLLHGSYRPDLKAGLAVLHGDGAEVTVVPVAPDVSMDVVGGKGREFLVNGTNYPPEGIRKTAPPPGAWRLEVTPRAEEREVRILTVLVVGQDTEADARAIRLDSGGGVQVVTLPGEAARAAVVIGTAGRCEAALSTNTAPGSRLHATIDDVARGERSERDVVVEDDQSVRFLLPGRGPYLIVLHSPASGG